MTSIPRSRVGDPVASQIAEERSEGSLAPIKRAVVTLLMAHRQMTGDELNEAYRNNAGFQGWPPCKYDSPRKRAGELVRDGVLVNINADTSRPAVYRLRVQP